MKYIEIKDCSYEDDEMLHIHTGDRLFLYNPNDTELAMFKLGLKPTKLVKFEFEGKPDWGIIEWDEI